ncbi:hypothetical protein DFR60_107201 [Hungatella effluvii]|uniref:Uncharacterized protein n=1 Tax=Hungatella effluvii TaxID=1096246 RepID=A0A2V3Y647_9FIRM|nr:hypothetical protein DFR60_107201 [Hungatella effluvii]
MLYRVFLSTNIYDERPIRLTILHFRRCKKLLRKGNLYLSHILLWMASYSSPRRILQFAIH